MRALVKVDLRHADLDGFNRFVFDHSLPASKDEPQWHFKDRLEVEYDGLHQIQLLHQLFASAGALPKQFTVEQIEQGLWFLFTPGEDYLVQLLWSRDVPWPERASCIAAIGALYSDLFSQIDVETIDYMIPDMLVNCCGFDLEDGEKPAEQHTAALFALFTELLKSSDAATQYAGLHGLGHLSHPNRRDAIQAYLRSTPDISDSLRSYAADAMTGDIL